MKDVDLRDWYWTLIEPKINNKKKQNVLKGLKTEWSDRLTDRKILYDIIFEELPLLVIKYEWVEDYLKNCRNSDYDKENAIITKYINSKILSPKIRRGLMVKMNVKVCPYCNQQYVYALQMYKDGGRYMGDLDHVLPKKEYPLFALSLWK